MTGFDTKEIISTLQFSFIDIIQIIILTLGIYYLIKSFYKTRGWVLLKGMFFILVLYMIVVLTKMTTIQIIMQSLFGALTVAIVIMLQPELQRIIEILGKKNIKDFKSLFKKSEEKDLWYSEETIREIEKACQVMSANKTGALIVLERGIPLNTAVQSGISIKGKVSNQLLLNIFEKNTPLHDGAVIFRDNMVEAATCILPVSSSGIDKAYGTRHRAALGITEQSDAIAIVVSEETGGISVFCGEKMEKMKDEKDLSRAIKKRMVKSNEIIKKHRDTKTPNWVKYVSLVIGIVVWTCVVAITNPIIEKNIPNVPVKTINTDVLDGKNQTYTIREGEKINVKVRGPRNSIIPMTKDDLLAEADFEELSIVGAININVTPINGYTNIKIVNNNSIMKVDLEELVQVEVPLEIKIFNDYNQNRIVVPGDNEIATTIVTCPKSIANTVDKGILNVDASGKEDNFLVHVKPVFYDKNGAKIEETKISQSKDQIPVSINVYEVKEIPLKISMAEQDMTDDTYFILNNLSTETKTIKIGSDRKTMDKIKEIPIVIAPDVNSKSHESIIINLSQYLPENTYLAKTQESQLEINMDLTRYQKTIVQIGANDIEFSGYDPEQWTLNIKSVPSEIVLYKDADLIGEEFNMSMLHPSVKIEAQEEGVYDTKIVFTDIDGIRIVGEMKAQYELLEKE